jgi:Spy/CpxP family protein refolding chaperone
MRRMMRFGIVAVMVLGLTAIAGAQNQPLARGQGMGRGPGMSRGGGPRAALNLTAEQREKLQTIMQSQREAHQATMAQVRTLQKQLHEAIYGQAANEETAVGLAAKIATLESAARVQTQLAVRAILTAEQIETLRTSGLDFPPMGPGDMRGGPGGRRPSPKW